MKYLARQHGYVLKTIEAAVELNTEQKTVLFKKAAKRLITFNGLKVAVLGLTFKPGTDDMREAPSLDNIRLLLEHGAEIYAYDPVGVKNCQGIYPDKITYAETHQEALRGASLCFIFTEWDEIKALEPEAYKWLMRTPLVYDGRNIYGMDEMREAGVEYYCIGRTYVQESPVLSVSNGNVAYRRKRLYRDKSISYANKSGSYGNVSV